MGLPAVLLTLLLAGSAEVAEIRDYLDRGMRKTARLRLDSFLEQNPDAPEGQAFVAEFAIYDDDWDAVEKAARRAVVLDKEWPPRYMMLWARARFEQGRADAAAGKPADAVKKRFAQAEAGFRRVKEAEPDHPDVQWWIAWTKEWQGFPGVAEQFYELQIEEHPQAPGGYLRLGKLLAVRAARTDDEKGMAEALATFDRGLAEAGEDAELLYHRALLLLETGDREGALLSLERSVTADPDYEESWFRLLKILGEGKILPVALRVLSDHPTAAWPAWRVGYRTANRDPGRREKAWTKHEKALRYVLPALTRNGDHEELYKIAFRCAQALIGETPKKAHNAKAAVAAFERIHEAYVWSADAANNLGFYLREVRKYKKSLAWYLKSVERAPENQDILNDTGLMYLFHFKKEKAMGLPFFLKTVALVTEGDQLPERGYWDALENLAKHYWEVDRQPEKVIAYAKMRYEVTKGVKPYNMSQRAAGHAKLAEKALGK